MFYRRLVSLETYFGRAKQYVLEHDFLNRKQRVFMTIELPSEFENFTPFESRTVAVEGQKRKMRKNLKHENIIS